MIGEAGTEIIKADATVGIFPDFFVVAVFFLVAISESLLAYFIVNESEIVTVKRSFGEILQVFFVVNFLTTLLGFFVAPFFAASFSLFIVGPYILTVFLESYLLLMLVEELKESAILSFLTNSLSYTLLVAIIVQLL